MTRSPYKSQRPLAKFKRLAYVHGPTLSVGALLLFCCACWVAAIIGALAS